MKNIGKTICYSKLSLLLAIFLMTSVGTAQRAWGLSLSPELAVTLLNALDPAASGLSTLETQLENPKNYVDESPATTRIRNMGLNFTGDAIQSVNGMVTRAQEIAAGAPGDSNEFFDELQVIAAVFKVIEQDNGETRVSGPMKPVTDRMTGEASGVATSSIGAIGVAAIAGAAAIAAAAGGGGGGSEPPTPPVETSCVDNIDNDGDGFVDCDDSDCSADPSCQPSCGDGTVDPGEQCDPASNQITCGDGFRCDSQCQCVMI